MSKVFVALHPAEAFRAPKMRIVQMADWNRVRRILEGKWPVQIPPYKLVGSDPASLALFDAFVTNATQQSTPFLAVDTEFTRDSRYLTVLGASYPGASYGVQIWADQLDPVSRRRIIHGLRQLFITIPTVFQNSLADIPVIHRNLGITYSDYKDIQDTLLEHAVLWSDWPHTLEFLASIYGKYPKLKHLNSTDPSLYNWGDVIETISVHEGLQEEFKRDPLSRKVYETQSLPLIPILLKRMEKGIRVNQARVAPALEHYKTLVEQAQLLGQACAGWPINIGSDDQLKLYLYDYLGLPVQKDRKTKKATTDGDAIAALRVLVGPAPDLESEEKEGLSLTAVQGRLDSGANGVLEARVLYAGARQILSHYLLPLLEAKRGQASTVVDRIYPDFEVHAQASGRWSITNPPLAQLPNGLRDIIIPDLETAWVAWDWDQIELRLLAALAQDKVYLDAFEKGLDVHAINARHIFDTSDEMGKEDPRRLFAKRFVYRLNYGGHPGTAGDVPGARQLGLTPGNLVAASSRYLSAHPAMLRWRQDVEREVRTTGVSRTFMGRRRRLLGTGMSALREAYNHPMQGGVADILNTTTIQIANALPYATLVYTMHDAATWEVPRHKVEEAERVVHDLVTQPWDVQGVKVAIPAKFKKVIYG